jgi:pimeloyl-[acyl-carrier protein] methyl ester esterase
MLPGLDGTGRLFAPLLPHLSPQLEPLVLSYPAQEALSYRELLPIVLSSLPTSGQFILLAESFSGPLGVLAAAQHPQGLLGLVLVASFVRSPLPRALSPLAPLVRGWLLSVSPAALHLSVLLGHSASEELRAQFREVVATVPSSVLAARVRNVLNVNVVAELLAVNVPILYLAASNDALVRPRSLRLIQQVAPQVNAVTIASSHLLLQTAPHEASSVISSFAASVGAF